MAQLAITDQEAADMEGKITNILGWFDQLQTVDTRGVVPAIHASQQGTVLRDDTPAACNLRAELLSLAPAQEKDYVRVPRTATGADADTNGAGKPAVAAVAGSAPPPSASPAGGATAASDVARDALRVMDFRVGRIVSCEKHPEADSLYVEKIDVGEAQPRVIVSGLVKHVPIEDMQDRMVVVIANLKPRNMRGIKSAGMVLAASDAEKTRVVPVLPPAGAVVGERLWFGGDKEQAAPAVPNAVEKKKLWDAVAPGLRTDSRGVATWNGLAMNTSAGPVTVPDLPDCRVA